MASAFAADIGGWPGFTTKFLDPPSGKTGDKQALIFIVGADCTQESYFDHMMAIQDKVDFPLLVALPTVPGDMAIPPVVGLMISTAVEDLRVKKNFVADKMFYGGHSLGGASIASWAHTNAQQVKGVFMWGSYINDAILDPAKDYGAPSLTVGAEMDGWMARITRIAKSYDRMKASSLG
jgi:hypothetical protein